MSKFRKRPVVVEAFRWTGGPDQEEDPEWIVEEIKHGTVLVRSGFIAISTLEGVMSAHPGDYIIQGVNGEIYPCKPDIFEKTYEAVSDQDPPQENTAPDLLEACEKALAYIVNGLGLEFDCNGEVCAEVAQLRAAIAKAKGQ